MGLGDISRQFLLKSQYIVTCKTANGVYYLVFWSEMRLGSVLAVSMCVIWTLEWRTGKL